jgi:hypothetical protein
MSMNDGDQDGYGHTDAAREQGLRGLLDMARVELAAALRERNEARAEVAACLSFLNTELDWSYFRSEFLFDKNSAHTNSSTNNASKLREFLAKTGHGSHLAQRLAALERVVECLRQAGDLPIAIGFCRDWWDARKESLAALDALPAAAQADAKKEEL